MNYLSNLAVNHLDKALSIDDKHQKSIALLCDIYVNHSEYKKALELLKAYRKKDFFFNFLSARLQFKRKNYDKAADFITACINEREYNLDSLVLAKNIFSKKKDLLRYKICLEKIVSSNTDQYLYYIELASCYNHTDEHENAMALLEIALNLTQNKQEVLLSVLERVLDKYHIDDDGLLIRDIDIDRLKYYYLKLTNFEVKDTKHLALAKKFLESNLLEFALKEVNKIDKKSGDIYHHIHGINLFSSNQYDASLNHLKKVSKNYQDFHFVASLLAQIMLHKKETKKANQTLLHALKLIKENLDLKSNEINEQSNLDNFDQVYLLTIQSNNLKKEFDRCNELLSLSS